MAPTPTEPPLFLPVYNKPSKIVASAMVSVIHAHNFTHNWVGSHSFCSASVAPGFGLASTHHRGFRPPWVGSRRGIRSSVPWISTVPFVVAISSARWRRTWNTFRPPIRAAGIPGCGVVYPSKTWSSLFCRWLSMPFHWLLSIADQPLRGPSWPGSWYTS